MATTLKPIETVYNGYRFRSRLEARWAVFFDEVGVEYEYEKEGFKLPETGWYLPDFWLPARNCWVEIKGAEATQEERAKCEELALVSELEVLLFCGDPWQARARAKYVFSAFTDKEEVAWAHDLLSGPEISKTGLSEKGQVWDTSQAFYEIAAGQCRIVDFQWRICRDCGYVDVGEHRKPAGCGKPGHFAIADSGQIEGAARAARQARFEHGAR